MSQTPAVSGKQLVKILERQGWYVKRVRGSHWERRSDLAPLRRFELAPPPSDWRLTV